MIDIGIDEDGYSSRLLISQALRSYPTASLYQFLEDKSVIVRSAAAREVQIRGDSDSFRHAMAIISDKRAYVREIGVFVLGQLGTPSYPFRAESIDPIIDRLSRDKSTSVRAAAAAALGHLKANEGVDVLAAAAHDGSAEVRACVAFALSNMKRRAKARLALRSLREDVSAEVRLWANAP